MVEILFTNRHQFFIMNNTIGFPPADALLSALSNVNYSKLLYRFLMLMAAVAGVTVAVFQFAYTRAYARYTAGGKEQLAEYIHLAALFLNNKTGILNKTYALMVAFYNRIELLAYKM